MSSFSFYNGLFQVLVSFGKDPDVHEPLLGYYQEKGWITFWGPLFQASVAW